MEALRRAARLALMIGENMELAEWAVLPAKPGG